MTFLTSLQRKERPAYDLVFSLGGACICSKILRRAYLQIASYPFDWVAGDTFENRLNLLTDDFAHYLDKKDLEFLVLPQKYSGDVYRNNRTNIVFYHDFPIGIPLDESYAGVRQKYDRRIARLLNNIEKAESVLMVYMEPFSVKETLSAAKIKRAFQKARERWPNKRVDLLYLKFNARGKTGEVKQENLSPHIVQISGNYFLKKNKKEDYDFKLLIRVLKNYRLKMPKRMKAKRVLLAKVADVTPLKFLKKRLRKKWHFG